MEPSTPISFTRSGFDFWNQSSSALLAQLREVDGSSTTIDIDLTEPQTNRGNVYPQIGCGVLYVSAFADQHDRTLTEL